MKNDYLPIVIALGSFQAFDHGEKIDQYVSVRLNPKTGDRIAWECGCNVSGTLEVVDVREREGEFLRCTLRKL